MYESSGSQFFRTTTGIQSWPGTSDESRFAMTFSNILRVAKILWSFRLVLEGKAGKEIPESSRLEFSENLLASNFALSDAEGSTSQQLNRGGIADLPLSRTLLAKVSRAKFLGNDGLFCLISISKFGSFKNYFARFTSLFGLSFRFRRLILLVQTIKMIYINYDSSTSIWKPWRCLRLDLILAMIIYSSIPTKTHSKKVTSSNRSTEFEDILPWNISQMIPKIVPITTRMVISYEVKQGTLLWVWQEVNWNWDNNMIQTSKWRESQCRTDNNIRRKKLFPQGFEILGWCPVGTFFSLGWSPF